jgi:ribosomal-protein-alanine N-acetyltransferase
MNKPHIKIRNLDLTELAILQQIDQAVNSTPWSLKSYQESWHNQAHAILGIFHKSVLCGACTYSTIAEEAEILQLCIAKPWQQQGLASCLLKHLITLVANQGMTMMFLEVMNENNIALNLYSNLGFNQVGVRKNYYLYQGKPRDAQILALQLK